MLLGYKSRKLGYQKKSQKAFLFVIILQILFCQTDYVLRSNEFDSFLFEASLFFSVFSAFAWLGYVQTFVEKKLDLKLTVIPFVVSLIILCINQVTMNDSLFYVIIAMVWLYYIASSVSCLYYAKKTTNYAQKKMYHALAIFIVPMMISLILQPFFSPIPCVCVSMAFSILVVFMNQQEQLISLDPLTQLNNRNSMEQYLFDCMCTFDDNMYLLVIDVNDFKMINDTYGHNRGDEILRDLANQLKKSCVSKSDFVARFGGDEFVIIHKGDDVDNLCACIHEQVSILSVSVSIGYAKYKKEYKRWMDWFGKADEELYKEKKKK